jgi:hypothetical protein
LEQFFLSSAGLTKWKKMGLGPFCLDQMMMMMMMMIAKKSMRGHEMTRHETVVEKA